MIIGALKVLDYLLQFKILFPSEILYGPQNLKEILGSKKTLTAVIVSEPAQSEHFVRLAYDNGF